MRRATLFTFPQQIIRQFMAKFHDGRRRRRRRRRVVVAVVAGGAGLCGGYPEDAPQMRKFGQPPSSATAVIASGSH